MKNKTPRYSQEQAEPDQFQAFGEQQQQAAIPIRMPFIRMEHGSNSPCVQKDPVPEAGSSVWLAGTLCYTSGTGASTVLNKCASDAVLCYGQSPDAAKGVAATSVLLEPPRALFGLNHYCFDVRDRIIEINISNASASGANIGLTTGVTWAGGGTNGVALAPGQQYGLITPTSGTYLDYQMLDVTDTTNLLFEIVALAPGQATTDNNPRVWVKIIPTKIQG